MSTDAIAMNPTAGGAPSLGQPAPSFRLASGQGPEIALEDYRGRKNVIVWFTKGMGCPFCRQHMSQLARSYPRIQTLGGEILEVSISTPTRARLYAKQFSLPFPYLCDPDNRVRRSYGLEVRSHSLLWYAKGFIQGARADHPSSDFGNFAPPPSELPRLLADDDMGFFIVDKQGVIRYALTGSYGVENGVRGIPSNDEIAREIERL